MELKADTPSSILSVSSLRARNPFNGIERDRGYRTLVSIRSNPFNGIESHFFHISFSIPQHNKESIQWNWKKLRSARGGLKLVENPFNGIESLENPPCSAVKANRIHSMELKAQVTPGCSSCYPARESIQWNWKMVDVAADIPTKIDMRFRIHSMELKGY